MKLGEKRWDRLNAVGLTPEGLSRAGILVVRGAALGIALVFALTPDPQFNLTLNLVMFGFACVWSYNDGVIVKRVWQICWIEGLLLYLAAIQVGNLALLVFDPPVAPAI
jgi:hypothetical protein